MRLLARNRRAFGCSRKRLSTVLSCVNALEVAQERIKQSSTGAVQLLTCAGITKCLFWVLFGRGAGR